MGLYMGTLGQEFMLFALLSSLCVLRIFGGFQLGVWSEQ